MQKYKGSCHCGAIEFSIKTKVEELTVCDCSLCTMKNALMIKVHQDHFVLGKGSDNLTEYNWNTKVARHFFCKTCGIYTFHKKRAQPDHYGVNVHCLAEMDLAEIPVKQTEGVSMSVEPAGARDVWRGPRS